MPAFHLLIRWRSEFKLTAAFTEGITPRNQLAPNLSELPRCGFLQDYFESSVQFEEAHSLSLCEHRIAPVLFG
jgi:hypothetical protein